MSKFTAALLLLAITNINAYVVPTQKSTTQRSTSSTMLHSIQSDRRTLLRTSFGAAMGILGVTSNGSPASATYSAYTAREKDWEARMEKGEVKFSNARSLRQQLHDIAPMNDDSVSKVFCPNGPSAAVSPLMENKCGDRLATPSVYGRTEDIVGNSIPGFKGGRYPGINVGDTTSLSAVGGFPEYKGDVRRK